MKDHPPRRILVLGTRLGEPTSFWNPVMIPAQGFIHVDIDPDVPGAAYPTATTLPVCADIDLFVGALLQRLPGAAHAALPSSYPRTVPHRIELDGTRMIRPEALMAAIQRVVIDRHHGLVMAELGNSFAWATHHLRFEIPGNTGSAPASDRWVIAQRVLSAPGWRVVPPQWPLSATARC